MTEKLNLVLRWNGRNRSSKLVFPSEPERAADCRRRS